MSLPRLSALFRIDAPAKVAAYYAIFGASWIICTDGLVAWLQGEAKGLWNPDTAKGLLFIAMTAALIHLLARRMYARQAELSRALAESQERWEAALESAGDGVWDWDVANDRMFYSERAKETFGYSGVPVGDSAQEWLQRVHPDDRAAMEQALARHFADGRVRYEAEFRFRCHDGTYKWALSRGRIIRRTPDGRPLRMIGSVMDIANRKSAESRLGDTLAFSKALLQFAPIGIVAYGPDGRAAFANERAAGIAGTDVAGLLQRNLREVEPWRQHGLLAGAEKAIVTGREGVHAGPLVALNGQARWIEARFVPFQFGGGAHLLLLLSDETAEHRALDRLHLMQAAAEAAPVGWVVTNTAGVIEWVNAGFTTMTGYSAAEAIGRHTRLLRSGRHSPEHYAALWQALGRGEIWSGELINRRKDGSFSHEYNTIAPVRDSAGVITHFVAIKQDITERKELEQQLARSQRLESIGLLASGIAHDLNNMLSPILLAAGMIKARHADRETKGQVEMIETAAVRGAGVLRQVLTFARGVEGERARLEPKPLVKEVAQLAEETFPREIRVLVHCGPGLRAVNGDLTQLHQVLLNLAVNARDAMPEGGQLTLYAHNTVVDEARAARQVTQVAPGDYVALGVRDTGTGIPPDVVEHMFEPFFTTKPRGKGTGLGLSTVYGIVRSHGGFIEVITELGRGTDMRILLPALGVADAGDAPVADPAAGLKGEGRLVLVVDDEEAVRLVTCAVLEQYDFRTVQAADGEEAGRIFGARPWDFSAAVVDLMMPRRNGYAFIRDLRELRPDLPVVAISGLTSNSPAEDGYAALARSGVSTLLAKPYTANDLLSALAAELTPLGADAETKKKG